MTESSSNSNPLRDPETPPIISDGTASQETHTPPTPENQGQGIFTNLENMVLSGIPKAVDRIRLKSTEKKITRLEDEGDKSPNVVAKSDAKLHSNMRRAVVNEGLVKSYGPELKNGRAKRIHRKNSKKIYKNAKTAENVTGTGTHSTVERLEHLSTKKEQLQRKLNIETVSDHGDSNPTTSRTDRRERLIIPASDRATVTVAEELLREDVESISIDSLDELLKGMPGYSDKLAAFTLNKLTNNSVIDEFTDAEGNKAYRVRDDLYKRVEDDPSSEDGLQTYINNVLYGENNRYRPLPTEQIEETRRLDLEERVQAEADRRRAKETTRGGHEHRRREVPEANPSSTEPESKASESTSEALDYRKIKEVWSSIEDEIRHRSRERTPESEFTASFDRATVVRYELRENLLRGLSEPQQKELNAEFGEMDARADEEAKTEVAPYLTEEFFQEIGGNLDRYFSLNNGRYRRVNGLTHKDNLSEEAEDDIWKVSADQAILQFVRKYSLNNNDRVVKAIGSKFADFLNIEQYQPEPEADQERG